jgi:hypothetical protein
VRERLYRGRCRDDAQLDATLQLFQDHRDEIYGLFQNQVDLEAKTTERTVEYLDEFYEIISDPKKVKREIRDRCRAL